MSGERAEYFERYFDTTAGITDRQIADFVISHEPERRLTGGFDLMIARDTFRRHFHDLLPYFEDECARTGSPNLKETRRLTHYLDKRTGIQTDLPEMTIIGKLHEIVSKELAENRRRALGSSESNDIYQEAMEEINDFQKNHHLEPALHRIEIAIAELNLQIETATRHASRAEDDIRQLELKEKERSTLRAARSTLLEKYLSPNSMH